MDSSASQSKNTIAVVGLGYVGLPMAVALARKHRVLGFDIDVARIDALHRGEDRTREVPGETLRDLLAIGALRLSADAAALSSASIFIVTVPTPVDEAHKPDLRPLISASQLIGKAMRPGAIVVYESTVYPGCTESDCVPELERASGLRWMRDFHVAYSPERINPGDREHTFSKIKKVVGADDVATLDAVAQLYESVVEAGVHRAPSIKVAEAAKVIENTQRDLNIALMNELAVLFKRMNIDTQDVLDAAGTKWNFLPFRPGLVGGHCIGVDPYYLTHEAERLGYIPQVIAAGRRINDNMGRFVARNLVKTMLQNGIDAARARVGVMGITFKENCPDVRNSTAVDIVGELQDHGIEVVVVDPAVNLDELQREHGLSLGSIAATSPVDALVVAVSHREYRAMQASQWRSLLRGEKPVLVDVKSIAPRDELRAQGVTVWRL